MTLRELTFGFDFWSWVHLRMAMTHLPTKFGAKSSIQYGVVEILPKFKMAAAAILDFQLMWIWPFQRIGSVVFVFCSKFGSNICYGHWDRRTYAPDSRRSFDDVTRINFRFRLLVKWSFPHGRDASFHILVQISVSSPELLTFIRNSRWRRPPSWIVRLCVFGHSGVLIVWYLCSVPNFVQICYSHWDRRT